MVKNRQNKITLTLPEPMFKKLNEEKNKFSYTTVQEVIYEVLRDRFFRNYFFEGKEKSNRGRPREGINLFKVGSAKKIFSD